MSNFRAFYKKHRERLFAYLMRSTGDYYLAGDILQESFTRYLEKYGEAWQNPALLYTIARNAVVDGHRKQGRDTPLLDEQEPSPNNPETHMLVREDYRRVLAAMQELAPEERDILSLVVMFFVTAQQEQPLLTTYRFVLYQPDVNQVEITGSFLGWESVAMKKSGTSGYWEAVLELPAGEHRLCYILEGGRRIPDPTIPIREKDDFGSRNCVYVPGK